MKTFITQFKRLMEDHGARIVVDPSLENRFIEKNGEIFNLSDYSLHGLTISKTEWANGKREDGK